VSSGRTGRSGPDTRKAASGHALKYTRSCTLPTHYGGTRHPSYTCMHAEAALRKAGPSAICGRVRGSFPLYNTLTGPPFLMDQGLQRVERKPNPGVLYSLPLILPPCERERNKSNIWCPFQREGPGRSSRYIEREREKEREERSQEVFWPVSSLRSDRRPTKRLVADRGDPDPWH
jgi:hypothetical protein